MALMPDRLTPLDIEVPEEFNKEREVGKTIGKSRTGLKILMASLLGLAVAIGPRVELVDDNRAATAEVLTQGSFEERIAKKSKWISGIHGIEKPIVRMTELNVIIPVNLKGELPDEALSDDGDLITDSGKVAIFEHGSGTFFTFFNGETGYYSGKSEKGAIEELKQSWEFANRKKAPSTPDIPENQNDIKLASLSAK